MKSPIRYGTAHFPSRTHAINYFAPFEGSRQAAERAVDLKLAEQSIFIGRPPTQPGDVLTVEDSRYHVAGVAR